MPVTAAAPGASELEKLTHGHCVKRYPPNSVSMEECLLAVRDIVGNGSMKSASRVNKMVVFVGSTDKAARKNRALVLFVEKVLQVNWVVEAVISAG